jgi:surface antigen
MQHEQYDQDINSSSDSPRVLERINDTVDGLRGTIRRYVLIGLFAAAALGGATVEDAANPSTAHADTLSYPNYDMPCEHYPYNTAGACANYDWGPIHTETYNDPSENSSRGYAYRNCTDFVAWKIDSLGGDVPHTLGNGGQWYGNAPASERSLTPAAGDAAVEPGNPGHVAFIDSVNADGTITVEEYNEHEDGTGDTRTGYPASMGFTRFVDFGVTPSGPVSETPPNPFKPNYLAASTNADGEIELFGVGTDNKVYWTQQTAPNTDSWTNWGAINADVDSVAAGVAADGSIYEFGVASNGSVYYRYQETPGLNDWSDEQSIDANVAGPISVATNPDGTMELYAVGTNEELYWTREDGDNEASWGNWGEINAGAIGSAATENEDGRLSEFIVGTNDEVYYRDQGTAGEDDYGDEQSIASTVNGQIAAVTNPTDGSIELFATGTNGDIYWTRQSTPSTDTWNNWGEINAGATSLAAAVNEDGSVEEFTIGSNGEVYYRYQETPGEDDWSDEENIDANLIH